ncbi:glycoside hydrolase family 17 protein [Hypoxylon crocopeplum]|nr:glycoside hydrolase family 17 protein [Hypoxylon crocopeplum]
MKATFAVAAAAALAGGVSAGSIHHRHAHDAFRALEKKGYDNGTCGCTTIYSTYYGEATLSFPPVPPTTSIPIPVPTSTSTPAPATVTSTAVVVPTPIAQVCPTTGVYTFPATTITLTESTTVCAPSTTAVPSGTHTVGGVTTIVTTATTVTCPYATVSTSEGVTTSIVATTTYVCPSAGTYTIAPTTTTVSEYTTITVPVVTNYPPGTYTAPEVVTTITETSTVVYCPFNVPSPTPSTTAVVVPTTYPVASPTTEKATVYPTSTATKPKPTGTLGGSVGKPWGISYTPYQTDEQGGCKSKSEVEKDIAAIAGAGVTTVRVYSTDCDTLPNVGSACAKHGLKMILGIFIDAPGCDAHNPSVAEQISAIKSWAQWDIVDLISVGNEAVFHGYCQPSELASLITKCKGEFSGYTGKYTTADTVNIWQQSDFSSALCAVVDVAGANAHAFFNTETDASQAGQFVKSQLDIIDSICSDAPGIILETGWPSAGEALGLAVPGVSQQAEAVKSIIKECGDKAVMFSLTSDQWKDPNTPCKCEQHFGLSTALGISM